MFRLHAPDGSEFLAQGGQLGTAGGVGKSSFQELVSSFLCLFVWFQFARCYPDLIQVKKIKFHAGLPPSQQLTSYKAFDETSEQNVV